MIEAGAVRALGAMSGTSLDGVDAAVVDTDGVEIDRFGPTGYRAYGAEERAVLRAALGLWPGAPGVAAAEIVVESGHAALLGGFDDAALIGFHGQTLAHDPGGRGTHQAGRGDRLADGLGRPVAWDFRTADVAAGGQGAPLAPFFHFACARWIGAAAPVVFLNLGGVGNVSWVDPGAVGPEAPGAVLAFDTGPANAPIDDLMRARRDADRDSDGALAAAGVPDAAVVTRCLAEPFFARPPPKSLDRDAFAGLAAAVAHLDDADAAATLAAVAAAAVARGCEHLPAAPGRVLVAGGGRHNRALMALLAAQLPCAVAPVEEVGLDGDMLEAQAFAYLAVRVARGLAISAPGTTGVPAPARGGRISVPRGRPA